MSNLDVSNHPAVDRIRLGSVLLVDRVRIRLVQVCGQTLIASQSGLFPLRSSRYMDSTLVKEGLYISQWCKHADSVRNSAILTLTGPQNR